MLDTAKNNPIGYIEYRLRDIRTKINTVASTTDEYMEAVLTAGVQKPDNEPYLWDMLQVSRDLDKAISLLQVDIMQQMAYMKKGGKA